MTATDADVEAVAHAVCPELLFALHGERRECEMCPASSYYPEVDRQGTRYCRVAAEKAARAAIGDSRQQIHDIARGLLGAQEQRVFDAIYAAYPGEIARAQVADLVGLSPTASTLGVYIGRIAGFGIVENGSPGHVRAADWLFP